MNAPALPTTHKPPLAPLVPGPCLADMAPALLHELRRVIFWHDQLLPTDVARAKAVIAAAEACHDAPPPQR